MKKLSLNLDEIDVTSFVADEFEDVRGTVDANAATKQFSCVHVCGTVVAGQGDDDCTSGCVCCRFRPAPKPI
jgi:hypothetical protein